MPGPYSDSIKLITRDALMFSFGAYSSAAASLRRDQQGQDHLGRKKGIEWGLRVSSTRNRPCENLRTNEPESLYDVPLA